MASPVGSPPCKRLRVTSDPLSSLLRSGGCTISGDDKFQVDDPRQLACTLDNRLMLHSDLRAEVLRALEDLLSDPAQLHRTLIPMAAASPGVSHSGDSLMRVLLNVSCIQADVAEQLLHKLPEGSGTEDAEGRGVTIPQLILSQFRWLDHIVSSHKLTEKLLEVLSVCDEDTQRELIAFLPEVATDNAHGEIVEALEGIIDGDITFLKPVLDALSNMSLEKALNDQVVEMVCGKLHAMPVEELPSAVRFLLQTASADNASAVVAELRKSLHFVSPSDARRPGVDLKQKGKAGVNGEASLLDAMRTGLRFQPTMCQVFLKDIRELGSKGDRAGGGGEHRVFDVWVLLLLHALGGPYKKSVETLLPHKVADARITPHLLKCSVLGHAAALKESFPSLLRVAELLLRAKEEVVRDAGAAMYTHLFAAFTDAYHRQEVLGALVGHTGAGTPCESGAALGALVDLTRTQTAAMLPFAAFINSLLDYLDTFQEAQLSPLFEVFAALAAADNAPDMQQDTLRMVIRKQLSQPKLKFKRIGIIGGVTLAGCLAQLSADDAPLLEPSAIPPPRVAAALELLQMLRDLCRKEPASDAFLTDALAGLVDARTLHPTVLEALYERTQTEFEATFVDDLDDRGDLPAERALWRDAGGQEWRGSAWFNLDGDVAPVVLTLLPLLTSREAGARATVLSLCPTLRLLQTLERKMHGGLDAINALLGCPLLLPLQEDIWLEGELAEDTINQPTVQSWSDAIAETMCAALAFGASWMRELLNAYSSMVPPAATTTGDPDTDMKLLQRVRHTLHLEALLRNCLALHPRVRLPPIGDPLGGVAEPAAGGRATRGGGASSSRPCTERSQRGPTDDREAPSAAKAPKRSAGAAAGPAALGGRALEPGVLRLLALSPAGTGLSAADALTVYKFLLEDLKAKLAAAAAAPAPAAAGGEVGARPPAGALLEVVGPLLPFLRRHLETAVAVTRERTDPDVGEEGANEDEDVVLTDAYETVRLVLDAVKRLLAAPALQAAQRGATLYALVDAFARPLDAPRSTQAAACNRSVLTVDLVAAAFAFMEHLLQMHEWDLGTEVTLVQVMRELTKCMEKVPAVQGGASAAAGSELQRRLGDAATRVLERAHVGRWRPDQLEALVRLHLLHAEDPYAAIAHLATQVLTIVDVGEKGKKLEKEVPIQGYPSLSRSTLGPWYRAALEATASLFTRWNAALSASSNGIEEQLATGKRAAAALHALVSVAKVHGKRTLVLTHVLTFSARCFISFLKALDILEAHVHQHLRLIVQTVKEVQKSTRIIHTVISEAKNRKEGGLTSKIPPIKRTMEKLVFRVKLLTHGTEFGKDFKVGNLKHKALDGSVISSQLPADEEEDEGEQEDEPMDDDYDHEDHDTAQASDYECPTEEE